MARIVAIGALGVANGACCGAGTGLIFQGIRDPNNPLPQVMRRVARRRAHPLTRTGAWVAAIVASSAAIVCAVGIAVARAPDGTLQHFGDPTAAGEGARAAEPPAWLSRVFPQAAQRPDPLTERVLSSRAFTLYFRLLGAGIAIAISGAFAGSAGWAGTMLLAHAFSRRLAG